MRVNSCLVGSMLIEIPVKILCSGWYALYYNCFCPLSLVDDTIGKFSLLEVVVYICLPQSVTDVMKFPAALSHCAAHRIDVCPYKVAWREEWKKLFMYNEEA